MKAQDRLAPRVLRRHLGVASKDDGPRERLEDAAARVTLRTDMVRPTLKIVPQDFYPPRLSLRPPKSRPTSGTRPVQHAHGERAVKVPR